MTENNEQPVPDDLMRPGPNVQRIMHTGTVWFSVAVLATAIVTTGLLVLGWAPLHLPVLLGFMWWLGSLFVVLSIGLLGWSGCPILETSVAVANRNKTRTMQAGTLLLIVGGALSLLTVFLAR